MREAAWQAVVVLGTLDKKSRERIEESKEPKNQESRKIGKRTDYEN